MLSYRRLSAHRAGAAPHSAVAELGVVRRMSTHRVIHGLAIVSLSVVAVMSIIGSMRQFTGAPVEMRLAPFFGLAIWSLLLWKIWRRPRKWGLGVGIFLSLMIAFQSYLWWLGVNDAKLFDTLGASRSAANFILLYELPIFIAAVSCALLRFYSTRRRSCIQIRSRTSLPNDARTRWPAIHNSHGERPRARRHVP